MNLIRTSKFKYSLRGR